MQPGSKAPAGVFTLEYRLVGESRRKSRQLCNWRLPSQCWGSNLNRPLFCLRSMALFSSIC